MLLSEVYGVFAVTFSLCLETLVKSEQFSRFIGCVVHAKLEPLWSLCVCVIAVFLFQMKKIHLRNGAVKQNKSIHCCSYRFFSILDLPTIYL